jgi:hypothetical protein
MAGRNVRVYLKNREYDRFFDLLHEMAECMTVESRSVKGYIELIQRLYANKPGVFPDEQFRADLDEYSTFAGEFASSVREFFWSRTNEGTHHDIVFNIKRWEPYDENAWDAMFSQLTATLQPFLPDLWECQRRICSYPPGQSSDSGGIQKLLNDIGPKLDRLSLWCIPEGAEYQLFFHVFLQKIKYSCSSIHMYLDFIKRFYDENPEVDTAGIRADLDSFMMYVGEVYGSLQPFFWPGTFDDIPDGDVVDANPWLPYDENVWDAAPAQVSAVCEPFIRTARAYYEKIESVMLGLPEPEKIRGFVYGIRLDLNYMSRNLEHWNLLIGKR